MEDDLAVDVRCPWPVARASGPLLPNEIHVWCAATAIGDHLADRLTAILATDERQRAARYFSDRHRRRFIACRAAQRLILATYCGVPPAALKFNYSPLGKPALAEEGGAAGLAFNVSNSGDMALFAVATRRDLGVDVEHLRDNIDHDGLAQRFFATQERDNLRQLPGAAQLAGFFDCWTRKEAFLKAIGKGLTYPLERAIVSVGPDEPCRLISLDGDEIAASAWSLIPLAPAPGYVAAIATPGPEPHVRTLSWVWE